MSMAIVRLVAATAARIPKSRSLSKKYGPQWSLHTFKYSLAKGRN